MKWIAFIALLAAAPTLAQTHVGTVRQSPFLPGTSQIYDDREHFVGTARENPFIPGRTDLFDATGRSTGIELRDNPFDPTRTDIFDERPRSDR